MTDYLCFEFFKPHMFSEESKTCIAWQVRFHLFLLSTIFQLKIDIPKYTAMCNHHAPSVWWTHTSTIIVGKKNLRVFIRETSDGEVHISFCLVSNRSSPIHFFILLFLSLPLCRMEHSRKNCSFIQREKARSHFLCLSLSLLYTTGV